MNCTKCSQYQLEMSEAQVELQRAAYRAQAPRYRDGLTAKMTASLEKLKVKRNEARRKFLDHECADALVSA